MRQLLFLVALLMCGTASADNNWIFKIDLPDEVIKLEVTSEMKYCREQHADDVEEYARCFEVVLERVLIYHSSLEEKKWILSEAANRAAELRKAAEARLEEHQSN